MLFLLDLLFVIICLLLIFMVVITPSQSEGLASAFGGMGSDTFFGTKAHQHISKFTLFLAVAFLVLAVGINVVARTQKEKKDRFPGAPPPAPAAPGGTNPK
jgi:preprotein translocase subunit SecG